MVTTLDSDSKKQMAKPVTGGSRKVLVVNEITVIFKEKNMSEIKPLADQLCIMTAYLPREHIYHLEDWLQWHYQKGVCHFFLYDNTGSTAPHAGSGNSIAVNGKNKHGINIAEQTSHLSDNDINLLDAKICSRYPVTHVKWQPLDTNGSIVFKQGKAFDDFAKGDRWHDIANWCAFIDMDEFLVGDLSLPDDPEIGAVMMYQRRFPRLTQESSVRVHHHSFPVSTRRWGPKCLVRLSTFLTGEHIHYGLTTKRQIQTTVAWFNHYNHGTSNHEWMYKNAAALHIPIDNIPKFDQAFSMLDDTVAVTMANFTPHVIIPRSIA